MYLKLLFLILLLLFLLYISFRSLIDEKYSSCVYDPLTNISYIHVDTKNTIKNIQDSLNKQDNVYYIKNGGLYYNNKLIKKLLGCSKTNIEFMNNKYNVQLLS
tara:strand:- start:1932 stop:2240 length:309 start_codon:yes stop_codon:yes gene_type:complete